MSKLPNLSHNRLLFLLLALLQLIGPAAAGNQYYNYDDGAKSDDDVVDLSNEDMDSVSLMPVSCVN